MAVHLDMPSKFIYNQYKKQGLNANHGCNPMVIGNGFISPQVILR